MEKLKLMLVEDEPFLAKVVEESLLQKGYSVYCAADGKKAYNLLLNDNFDLVILDVMMPLMDGLSLAKQIRKINQQIPILFLTAKTSTADVIAGYESGGNDYLKKPFSLEELFLRVAELLKRNNLHQAVLSVNELTIGQYTFVSHKQELYYGEQMVKLSSREAELLLLLYKNKNNLTDRKHALLSLWGDDSFFNTRTMDVFITKLRKHLKRDPQIQIINMRGMGYKLIC